MMKLLISAYACEPGKGSEPEVGWQWVMELSRHCEVTVITRSNNRISIESELGKNDRDSIRFIYIDLSPWMQMAKKKIKPAFLGVSLYYARWQKLASKRISELVRDETYDVIHHLTFASFRLPYAVTGHGIPSVIGPVGGCEDFPPQLIPQSAFKVWLKESFRNWMTWRHTKLGWGMRRFREADIVLASTREMGEIFSHWGVPNEVISQIGMSLNDSEGCLKSVVKKEQLRLLFVGGLLCWKGIDLALVALEKLPVNVTLTLIGSGPDEVFLKKKTRELGLLNRVFFLGRKSREEVLELYKEYDVFFYPSLHDSGAFTVLEAMLCSLPVVCLNRGGPALSVIDDQCGLLIDAGMYDETCQKLAEAVLYYLRNPDELLKHGQAARQRVLDEYCWIRKGERMMSLYAKILSEREEPAHEN